MYTTTYTFKEVQEEAQKLAAKVIKESVEWEKSANDIREKTPEWYLLEHLKQTVNERAWLGILK